MWTNEKKSLNEWKNMQKRDEGRKDALSVYKCTTVLGGNGIKFRMREDCAN